MYCATYWKNKKLNGTTGPWPRFCIFWIFMQVFQKNLPTPLKRPILDRGNRGHPLKGVLATIWRSLRGHTQADLTRRLCKLCNWNFGIFWRMFPLIMESFKNIRELCLAAATDRWKSEKSAFLRVLVKKLQGPEKWFLENQSSTYRWESDLGRKKLRFNFEILFCSIFIRKIMA